MKIVIATGRNCVSASWINLRNLSHKLKNFKKTLLTTKTHPEASNWPMASPKSWIPVQAYKREKKGSIGFRVMSIMTPPKFT